VIVPNNLTDAKKLSNDRGNVRFAHPSQQDPLNRLPPERHAAKPKRWPVSTKARRTMRRLRREIDAVRPRYGACLRIDRNLSKIGRVVQWRQDTCPPFSREVDVSDRAIAEQQTEHTFTTTAAPTTTGR
jgi:hypothetical protein